MNILSIDLGGTNCRFGLFNEEALLLKTWRISSKPFQEPENISSILADELEKKREGLEINAISLGIPGLVSSEGTVLTSPNYPKWEKLPIKELLQQKTGLPVFVENDANLYTLGESFAGEGKGADNFLLLTLGTGIGGGIFLKGDLYRGSKGMAGEIGHITIHPNGPTCGCGKKGCLEAYASGTAIKRQFTELTGLSLEAKEIYELAKKGDKTALKVFDKAGFYLGVAIGSLLNILDVDIIILGGGLSLAFDLLSPHIKKGLKDHTFQTHFETVQIKVSKLQDEAGLYGGYLLAKRALKC